MGYRAIACLFIGLVIATSGHAQFFGGYADGVTIAPTGYNTGPSLRMVYDDFTFDIAGDINFFGIVGLSNMGSPVAMYYEIRSGVSEGDGGTLLLSGFWAGGTFSALPTDGSFGPPPSGSGTYGLFSSSVGDASAIHLAAGTYWIGLAPLEQFGSFDVASTAGLGSIGHPINNGNAFYYNSDGSANFASMGDNDFALKIGTLATTSIPEPGTATLVGLASLPLLCLRRRK